MCSRTVLALTCVLTGACSLLFDSADGRSGPNGEPPEECLGIQRVYDIGVELAPLQYEHIDYAQGTVTFWAKALQLPVVGESVLIDLGGIRVATNASGDARVDIPGAPSATFPGVIEWQDGEAANDVFLALRWDTKRALTGSQVPAAYVMLRVGESTRNYGTEQPFAAGPVESTEMKVGDAAGAFHVDQLVVYSRPLFVSNSVADSEPDQLRDLGAEKTASARLAGGSHEVSFATSAPPLAGCGDDYKALAWTNSPELSVLPGNVRGGDSTGWTVPPTVPMPESERVFSSGFAIGEVPAVAQVRLTPNTSYHFYALAHGQGNARPMLRVSALGGQDLIRKVANDATLEKPQVLTGSFTVPANASTIEFALEQALPAIADLAIFHTLIIRENLLGNSSFEIPDSDELPEGIPAPWLARAEAALAARKSELTHYANAGHYSVCFEGTGQPNDLHQHIDAELENELFYAMGASFYWYPGASKAPGVTAGSSGFFGTGAPYPYGRRSEQRVAEQDRWEAIGTVAYRLFGEQYAATNDDIFFGSLGSQASDEVAFCVDDAYVFAVSPVTGTTAPAN